jgi:hypothetical protein
MQRAVGLLVAGAVALAALPVRAAQGAQGTAASPPPASPASASIPLRDAVPVARSDSGVFRFIAQVRALSNGSVIVNDYAARRIVLVDSTLQRLTVLADTAPGAPNQYGRIQPALVRYRGDSTLFVDRDAQALIVIDPSGKFGRVAAPPVATDIPFLTGFNQAEPGADLDGNLIYRSVRRLPPAPPPPPDPSGRPVPRQQPDSAPIVRANFDTRTVDTVALLKIAVSRTTPVLVAGGRYILAGGMNPLPTTDDWAVMHDGTIAVVRAADYHVDWYHPDGRVTSTPRMPFDWRRITFEEKVALLDSVRVAGQARRDQEREAMAERARASGAGTAQIDLMAMEMSVPFLVAAPEELADYYPPVRAGTTRADPNGNLWVLPSTTLHAGQGLVYDVVNRAGEIVERVRLPEGRNLMSIGADGSLYLAHAPHPSQIALERARVRR